MSSAQSETPSTLPVSALSSYVHDRAGAYVDLLARLARAESPSTDPNAQQEVQAIMTEALDDLGYAVTHLPGEKTGGALYARPADRRKTTPTQLLLGHGDTVWPKGTLDDMPVTLDEGVLRGPGVFDMKAGLTSIVFALRALRAHDLRPSVTPLVLVTSDEEIGSPESRPYIERLAKVSERVYVLEPALGLDGKIKTARKGTGEMTLTVRAARGSTEGNVVLELSQLVQRLYDLHAPERGVTVNVGTIDGNQIDDERGVSNGQLVVDVRVPSHDAADEVYGAIRKLEAQTPGVTVEVDGGLGRPPLERTPGNQRLWRLARRLGHSLGLELEEGRAGGGSDGNITSLHTPTLDGLGAVGDGAHAEHEFIQVDNTLDRCVLLALLLLAPPISEGDRGEGDDQYSIRSS